MKYLLLLSIISMNFFIIVSTFFKETLNFNIDGFYFTTMIFIEIVAFLYLAKKIISFKQVNTKYLYLIVLIFVIALSYFISEYNTLDLSKNNFIFYLLWAVPASICGIEIHNIKKHTVDKFFKVIFTLFTICLFFIILVPYIFGSLPNYINFGLLNYQNTSYIAAFVFGLGMYFFTENSTRFKAFYLISSGLMVPIIFIASGRGGAVLLIIYIIMVSMGIIKNKKVPLVNKVIFSSIIIILILTIAIVAISLDKDGRTFSYLSSDGISLNETSGRGDIYDLDFYFIGQRPLTGYGLFNYYHLLDNIPHNIILELLLISGFVGTLIIVFSLLTLVFKYIKYYDGNSTDRIVGFLFIYPLTLLMFSSNLLIVSELWFGIFYLLAKPKEKKYDKV